MSEGGADEARRDAVAGPGRAVPSEPSTPRDAESTPAPRHHLRYVARSDRGLIRATNQDSVLAGNRLLVIADGMGGHAAGDTASRLVVAAFAPLNDRAPGLDLLSDLVTATREGNEAIAEMVAENPDLDGMGTTVTAMLFDGDRVGMAHVGDSRAYLYRSGVLHQLTHDDTFVQSLVDDGRITEDEAQHHPQRNLLLRALNGTELDPSLAQREVRAGDRYLLCSDGLSGVVGAEVIADALAEPDPERVADILIQRALLRGGPDNVTVIVADVIDTGMVPAPGPVTAATHDPDATGPIQQLTREMPRVPLPPIPEEPGAPAEFVAAQDDEDFGDEDSDEADGDGEDLDGDTDGDGIEEADGEVGSAWDGAAGSTAAAAGLRNGGRGRAGGTEAESGDGATAADRSGSQARRASGSGPGGPRRPGVTGPTRRRSWHRRGALALAVVVLVLVALAGSTLWVRSQYYVGVSGDTVAVFRGVNGSLLGLRFSTFQEDSCAGSPDCRPIKVSDLQPAARNQVLAGIQAGSLGDARDVMSRLSGELLPPCPRLEASRGPTGPSTSPADPTRSGQGTPDGSRSSGTPGSRPASTSARPSTAAGTSAVTRTSGTAGAGAGTGAGHNTTDTATGTLGRAGDAGPGLTTAPAAGTTTGAGDSAATATAADAARGRAMAPPTPAAPQGDQAPVVSVQPAPTTLTVRVTVTPGPHALFDSLVQRALLAPVRAQAQPGAPQAAPDQAQAAPTTRSTVTAARSTPTTRNTGAATGTGTGTSGTKHSGTTAARPSTSTVTADTPTVTVTQTITAGPTVTGTPLAPAPAEPGVTCRTTG